MVNERLSSRETALGESLIQGLGYQGGAMEVSTCQPTIFSGKDIRNKYRLDLACESGRGHQ